jgi:hypothetical protein
LFLVRFSRLPDTRSRAWLLVEYPWGFGLFVLGGFMHWASPFPSRSLYSITSSARASSVGGASRPILAGIGVDSAA